MAPEDLWRSAWGFAAVGGTRPRCAEALAARVAELLTAGRLLDASALARTAFALATWATGAAALTPLWRLLHRWAMDLSSEEVLLVSSAALKLNVRDDELFLALQKRALVVGPFDAEGAEALSQCFFAYAQGTGDIRLRQSLAADFVTRAMRRGAGTPQVLGECLRPIGHF